MRFYLFLLFLLILSCNEKDSINLSPISAPASAIFNGSEWHADTVYCYYGDTCHPNRLFLRFYKHNQEGILREEWGFQKIVLDTTITQKMYASTKNSCFNDTLEASYATIINDGDVLGRLYIIKNDADNYLKIESYDTTSKEISGSFAGTYINTDGTTGLNTVKITNGKFHTKILY